MSIAPGAPFRWAATVVVLATGLLAAPAAAQIGGESSSPFAARYLMAFDACDTERVNCRNPRNDRVYLARSDDGRSWSPVPGVTSFRGNVPDLVRRGNTLYVYYLTFELLPIPEVLNVRRYDVETGVLLEASRVILQDAAGTSRAVVDPSPTLDDDGRIVLFALSHEGGNPGQCPVGVPLCTKVFLSATEVAGSNGMSFVVDPGDRFEITLPAGQGASDPDIFRGADSYLLYMQYAQGGNQVLAASSGDLRGTFERIPTLPDGVLSSGEGGIPAGHYDDLTRSHWLYVHHRPPGSGDIAIIRRAVHDGVNDPVPADAFETVIAGATFPGLGVAHTVESPGFAVNEVVAAVDVKPGSCPNPINPRARGVLPVAILGTADFAVTGIDASSIRLEGVAPERVELEDVAAPFHRLMGKASPMECTVAGPDGVEDLSVKFDQAAVLRSAEARFGSLPAGHVVTLRLTAELVDGGSLRGEDVVVIVGR
jgi:hypothetical protein